VFRYRLYSPDGDELPISLVCPRLRRGYRGLRVASNSGASPVGT